MARDVLNALYRSDTWETQDGRVIPFDELTEGHATNLVAWLERNAPRLQFAVGLLYAFLPYPNGDQAQVSYDQEHQFILDAEPVEFIRQTPAYRAALKRRDSFQKEAMPC